MAAEAAGVVRSRMRTVTGWKSDTMFAVYADHKQTIKRRSLHHRSSIYTHAMNWSGGSLSSSESSSMQIILLPWLQFEREVSVCGVFVNPRAQAIESAGDLGTALEEATSYFYESSKRLDRDGNAVDFVRAEPSVVIVADGVAAMERASVALNGLFFATMINASPYAYANATNFTRLSLLGLSTDHNGFVREGRTLFGPKKSMTRPEYSIEVRPHWCAEKTPLPHAEVLAIYEEASTHPDFGIIGSAIDALAEAMTDAPATPARFEFENYARALELLLSRATHDKDIRREEQNRLAALLIGTQTSGLRAIPNLPRDASQQDVARAVAAAGDVSPDGMLVIMRAIRGDRNSTSHPDSKVNAHTLHDQLTLRPNIVAFRIVSALIIASLAQLAPVKLTPQLRAYVVATAQWAAEYRALTQLTPGEALSRFGGLWASFSIRLERSIEA